MDGVVLDDTELIELLALGDESLLVRHSVCNSGRGWGGADMPIAVQQPKCRVERRE